MPKLDLFKMTSDRNYFVKGQKVWLVIPSGDLSYLCVGRFRGKGRWVMSWVHADPGKHYTFPHNRPDCDWKDTVEVSQQFYEYYRRIVGKIVKNEF
jgi:hypothetical protein